MYTLPHTYWKTNKQKKIFLEFLQGLKELTFKGISQWPLLYMSDHLKSQLLWTHSHQLWSDHWMSLIGFPALDCSLQRTPSDRLSTTFVVRQPLAQKPTGTPIASVVSPRLSLSKKMSLMYFPTSSSFSHLHVPCASSLVPWHIHWSCTPILPCCPNLCLPFVH